MTAKLLRRTAFAVIGLAAALLMTIALIRPAGAYLNDDLITGRILPPPTTYYGAIAYAPNGAWGKSWSHRTRAQAEASALQQCGIGSCKVLSSFTRCGAVAYDGTSRHGGHGPNRRMAEEDAIIRLGGGWIDNWACN